VELLRGAVKGSPKGLIYDIIIFSILGFGEKKMKNCDQFLTNTIRNDQFLVPIEGGRKNLPKFTEDLTRIYPECEWDGSEKSHLEPTGMDN